MKILSNWNKQGDDDANFYLNAPRFIVFEGGEGAGKTTLIDNVEQFFLEKGVAVVRTREPGGTFFGEQMRNWLLNRRLEMRIDAKAELLLFLSIRAQHIDELIAPALNSGKIVLCDRFNDSTIAYQGAGRQLGVEYVSQLCSLVCGKVVPDLVFYLDIDPKIGLGRTLATAKENAMAGYMDAIESEKIEFHIRVRKAFQMLAAAVPKRYCSINAEQPRDAVVKAALNLLQDLYRV